MEGAVRVRIEGRVQGVGYRAWLEYRATAEGLRGWARNRRDGTVEALLIGEWDKVMMVVEACRKGPRLAAVTALATTPEADDGSSGFRTLPTE